MAGYVGYPPPASEVYYEFCFIFARVIMKVGKRRININKMEFCWIMIYLCTYVISPLGEMSENEWVFICILGKRDFPYIRNTNLGK